MWVIITPRTSPIDAPSDVSPARQRLERLVGVPPGVDEVQASVGLEGVHEDVAQRAVGHGDGDAPHPRPHLLDGRKRSSGHALSLPSGNAPVRIPSGAPATIEGHLDLDVRHPGEAWWGEVWAERTVGSSLADQAVDYGVATRAELEEVAGGFRDWAERPDGTFVLVHGEIIARAPVGAPEA